MRFDKKMFLLPVMTALLAACGGGGTDAPPPRGAIITAQLAGQATAAQIDAGTAASGVLALTGAAECGVDIRYVLYMTRFNDQPATASAAVLVPSGAAAACTGTRPVLLYGHGTTTEKSYNMADIVNNPEGSLVAAMYAAHGYIVVAPNFLGYDKSSLTFTPYLNAEASAIDMVDGLRAAKSYLASVGGVAPNSRLFISGYSQGGHVAMATHKIIERDYPAEFTVTASAPMSGPHNLIKFTSQINSGPDVCPQLGSNDPNCTVNAGATIFTPLLLTSWQKSYGDLYKGANTVYQPAFAATTEDLFPTDTPLADLIAAGKLPADATFRKLFGTGGLILESFRAAFFTDPASGFKAAAQRNTLLGWTPKASMAMCYSMADPTVYAYNTTDAQADFGSRGVIVPALDVRGNLAVIAQTLGTGAAQIAGGFQLTYPAAGTQVGTPGTESDHANAAPFCSAFVRGYFQNFLN